MPWYKKRTHHFYEGCMNTSTIRISEIWSDAWDTTKKHFAALTGIALAIFGISIFGQFLQDTLFPISVPKEPPLGRLLIAFIIGCIEIAISLGWIRVCLRFVDGQQGTLGDLASALSSLPSALLQMLLLGLLMFVALIPLAILIVAVGPSPAVFVLATVLFLGFIFWVMLRYLLSFYLIVDKKMGAVQAMVESARLSKGIKGTLFLNILLGGILLALASLPVIIPLASSGLDAQTLMELPWWMQFYRLGSVLVVPLFGVASA